jgi:hypothetical protein
MARVTFDIETSLTPEKPEGLIDLTRVAPEVARPDLKD